MFPHILCSISSVSSDNVPVYAALIISILGSVIGPLITALINNRHQLKILKLQTQQSAYDSYVQKRSAAFQNFLSDVGRYISNSDFSNASGFGASFFIVYQYVPEYSWKLLDTLYEASLSSDIGEMKKYYAEVMHLIAKLSLEQPPKLP